MPHGDTRPTIAEDWTPVCRIDEIEPGRAKYVEARNRPLCVVRDFESGSAVQVFDDACPHAGQSLSGGHVEAGCIICPWHQWEFRLQNGENPDNPDIVARTYPCRVEDGVVFVQIPASR
jgi:nitrite reductase (NADH) small subunit/3-phenylpropionate/trans-cinnamate dioxygenase ferredoxin subunit